MFLYSVFYYYLEFLVFGYNLNKFIIVGGIKFVDYILGRFDFYGF